MFCDVSALCVNEQRNFDAPLRQAIARTRCLSFSKKLNVQPRKKWAQQTIAHGNRRKMSKLIVIIVYRFRENDAGELLY